MSEERGYSSRRWIDNAEEALGRTGEALRTAWNETRETRIATLESAKEATARLGRAIDEGIQAAKETWESSAPGESEEMRQPETAPGHSTPETPHHEEEE